MDRGRVVGLLLLWACNIAALWVADKLVSGFGYDTTRTLVIGAAVLAVVNWLLRPLVTLLALPLIIVTLGVAYLLLGVVMLYLMVHLTNGFHASGWAWLWAAVIVGIVNAVLRSAVGVERSGRRRR
ncbi:MAG: phage holin family protein [Thermoleophilia bacterium]